jgi:hypothetical protein
MAAEKVSRDKEMSTYKQKIEEAQTKFGDLQQNIKEL